MINARIAFLAEKVLSMLKMYVENVQNHPLRFQVIKRFRYSPMITMQNRSNLILSVKS